MLLETDKKILGQKFKTHRKAKGLTQFELAEKVGLNEKQISRIEAGLNYPTYLTLAKLLEVLEINVNEILLNAHQEKPHSHGEITRIVKNANPKEIKTYIDVLKVLKRNFKIIQDNSI